PPALDHQPEHGASRPYVEVGAAHHRMEVADRRAGAGPVALGELVPAHAILGGPVEVVVGGQAVGTRGLQEGGAHPIARAALRDAERSAAAVQLAGPPLVV